MYKLSEIVGKNVVSLFEAKNAGTLVNVLFDKSLTRVKYFEIFSDDDDDAAKKYFEPASIGCLENDAVIIKNCGKLMNRFSIPPVYVPGPVNAAVYNPSGIALGRVSDITLDGFSVQEINVGDRAFHPSDILSKSDEILIINDTGEKIKLVPPAKRVPSPTESASLTVKAHTVPSVSSVTQTVATEDISTAQDNNEQTAVVSSENEAKIIPMPEVIQEAHEDKGVDVPKKLPGENVSVTRTPAYEDNGKALGYAFLLGKMVTRTIFRDDGTVLADEGSRVDEAILGQADSANKLVQLALHSK